MLEATLSQRGQVTIPSEIRKRLGLKAHDRVRFQVDGDAVTIQAARSRIARHFGAVEPVGQTLDERAEREAFEQAVADDVANGDW